MTTPGLPPLFGFPWEREEQEVLAARRHGMTFSLTFEGKRRLGKLSREIQWDPMGLVQVAGTEEDAQVLAVLEAIDIDDERVTQWLDTPDIGPIVRRRLIGLFEAGYIKSHSMRDI